MRREAPRVTGFHLVAGPSLLSAAPVATLSVAWPAEMRTVDAGAHADLLARIPAGASSPHAPAHADGIAVEVAVAELAEALQRALGHRLPGAPVPDDARPAGMVAFRYRDADAANLAGRAALSMIGAAPAEQAAMLDGFLARASSIPVRGLMPAIREAADERGIPWERLIPGAPWMRLGQGAKQKRLQGTITSSTSHIGTVLSTQKHLAAQLFRANAVPAPKNAVVGDAGAAVRAAERFGYPVVVKPAAADFGLAVSVGLDNAPDVARAFEQARRHGRVLVEEQIPGDTYRLLVMHGRFVLAVRREPAHVVGDGVQSVRELVGVQNRARAADPSPGLKPVEIDADVVRMLRGQGMAPESVPPAGAKVRLRGQANRSAGGTYEDVTAAVHPDNRTLAERAASVAGLDVAGIDFVCPDIGRSYREAGGAICEINANPGLLTGETARLLARTLLDGMFPRGDDGRIPIIGILSDHDIGALVGRIEALMARRGHAPACATARELRAAGRPIAQGELAQAFACRAALAEPSATAAIVQLTYDGTVRDGLGFDSCALAVLDPVIAGARPVAPQPDEAARAGVAALLRSHADRVLAGASEEQVLGAVEELLAGGPRRGGSEA